MFEVFQHFTHANSGYIMPETVKSLLVRPMACIKERSCMEILGNDIEIYTLYQYMSYS